ncbi:MAG: Gfo/Idh/MocA family oxidoreductase [Flavobacteriales bacterium]|nr:Gfo/Idh/MocA family oxidoreductase [Flavobacteriia bacterium]NCP05232.1 Gfo/Idh/MocA family oxidoreductase [Flavobacteriales bacterium]PIV92469.1 MAG: oxidoreductase [Flavobacteriaceae bacterium CG17_big_fil_post_rev_8_21_14_2_50_33_15]PIY10620.1 MAG: oxidoreductase [Flavobacteriaceae bacterium CG_4_10_14_3_um_filter_33_47]PJB19833.1 MAG: oxidoreductase [Flavobacteriaceae bacterium CG_4_9_14_3_um_filter_33_16]
MTKQLQHNTIRWGIMGLGNIAHKFAQDLITIEGAQLHAVASRSEEKANEFALTYNALKVYSCYEDLVNDKNIDAIYIATPHALHHDNTLLCLNHGKAVLCEKPFAMNHSEVENMITKSKEKNVLLMEALWTRFLPHYQFVINQLHNKTYGNVLNMEASFGFFRAFNNDSRLFNKSLGGGSLLDIGIYPIFAALSTLGNPKSIEAKATFFDNGADASCDMIFTYDHNVKAYLKSSLLEDLPTEAIFYCERATIKINKQFHCPSTVSILVNNKEEHFDFNYKSIGYQYEVLHFNELLRHGKTESQLMSFQFSQDLISTLDAVRKLIKLNY